MSSDDIVLSVKNVSKCFEMYDKPRHRLQQMLLGPFGKKYYREFWALRDINFEVHRGECVGVIGRNGAGKSTLLQIVTGTLQPTFGEVSIQGRVAALLELGSGFNPEFTGRENVYMNAAILGLTKKETDDKFQEIVDFADIGEFIDQPVKTYSSGMMVRLAFAVNVAVNPDVLIVDEALAVGDSAFQRKCYARLERLVVNGTTLFIVTHNVEVVKRICSRVILLENHICKFDGDAQEGVALYMKYLFPKAFSDNTLTSCESIEASTSPIKFPKDDFYRLTWHREEFSRLNSFGAGGGKILNVTITGLTRPNILPIKGIIIIDMTIAWDTKIISQIIEKEGVPPILYCGFGLANHQNIRLFGGNTFNNGIHVSPKIPNHAHATFKINFPTLQKGEYFLVTALSLGNLNNAIHLDWNDNCLQLVSLNQIHGGFILPEMETSVELHN